MKKTQIDPCYTTPAPSTTKFIFTPPGGWPTPPRKITTDTPTTTPQPTTAQQTTPSIPPVTAGLSSDLTLYCASVYIMSLLISIRCRMGGGTLH